MSQLIRDSDVVNVAPLELDEKFLEFSAHIYRETLPVNREMSIFEGL